jgi:hypothetical protein
MLCTDHYLGSIMQNDGEIDREVNHRTQVGWLKRCCMQQMCGKTTMNRIINDSIRDG